jgi:hypothetical protein
MTIDLSVRVLLLPQLQPVPILLTHGHSTLQLTFFQKHILENSFFFILCFQSLGSFSFRLTIWLIEQVACAGERYLNDELHFFLTVISMESRTIFDTTLQDRSQFIGCFHMYFLSLLPYFNLITNHILNTQLIICFRQSESSYSISKHVAWFIYLLIILSSKLFLKCI